MVEKIYEIKNQLIQKIDKDIRERGIDRIDVMQLGELVDMVKDLAAAEESCWEASYYRSVSEAMESGKKSGYGSMNRSGYQQQPARQGYGSGSMGYHDLIDKLGEEYRNLTPDDRTTMRDQVLGMLGMM